MVSHGKKGLHGDVIPWFFLGQSDACRWQWHSWLLPSTWDLCRGTYSWKVSLTLPPLLQQFLCYMPLSVYKLLPPGSPKLGRASAHPVLSLHKTNPRPKGLSYRFMGDCRPGAGPKALDSGKFSLGYLLLHVELRKFTPFGLWSGAWKETVTHLQPDLPKSPNCVLLTKRKEM